MNTPFGYATSNILERVLASIGLLTDMPSRFDNNSDIEGAAVLLALPSLVTVGLLKYKSREFKMDKGYYSIDSIFMLLAFQALARISSIEQLRYQSPGEWGRIMGLDRIPEIKTLRGKIKSIANENDIKGWQKELCTDWMEAMPENAAILYIDGHVRVYTGKEKLAKHFVSRQKLCLKATTDYWCNDVEGQPFFKINKSIDPGIIRVIEDEAIPMLEELVPNQPSKEELEKNEWKKRFTIVFDREGYSPDFFYRCWKKRISILTYNKFPKDDWPKDEFQPIEIKNRLQAEIRQVAERGQQYDIKVSSGDLIVSNHFWVREFRDYRSDSHQTAVLSTDYEASAGENLSSTYNRWSQENFFKYMKNNFGLDALIDYDKAAIIDTTKVVNPAYRRLESKRKSVTGRLSRKKSMFADCQLKHKLGDKLVKKYEDRKAKILEEIRDLDDELATIKNEISETPRKILVGDLPEDETLVALADKSKSVIDTVKMIAYRAETAMVNIVREKMVSIDRARAFVAALYKRTANILVEKDSERLVIEIHNSANRADDLLVSHLCDELNMLEVSYPNTNIKISYRLAAIVPPL